MMIYLVDSGHYWSIVINCSISVSYQVTGYHHVTARYARSIYCDHVL